MKNILTALLAAKKEFEPIHKTKTNPHFKSKYADLDLIHKAIDPALSKHGLLVTQPVEVIDGKNILVTKIYHAETSEILMSRIELKSQDDTNPQKVGAALTYYRRYLLAGLLGIVADEDTDGGSGPGKTKANDQTMTSRSTPPKFISESQRKRLFAIAGEANWEHDNIKNYIAKFKITSTGEIPVQKYDEICQFIQSSPINP